MIEWLRSALVWIAGKLRPADAWVDARLRSAAGWVRRAVAWVALPLWSAIGWVAGHLRRAAGRVVAPLRPAVARVIAWIERKTDNARSWMLAALIVAVAALVIITERLDHALGSLIATKEATGRWPDLGTPDLVLWWAVVVLAFALGSLLASISIKRAFTEPSGWHRPAGWILLAAWSAWIFIGALSISCGGFGGLVRSAQDYSRFGITALVVVMLVAAGNELGVNAGSTWDTARLVRVHLLVLGVLFGLIYVLSMTAGQAADVIRTWGDSSVAEPAFALVAALLLGEMIRESGLRMVAAQDTAAMRLTAGAGPDDNGQRAFRFMAAIPVAILFVGAVSAGADSVLLDTSLDGPARQSVDIAVLCGVVLTVLMRTVVEPVTEVVDPVEDPVAPVASPLPIVACTLFVAAALALAILLAFVPLLAVALLPAFILFIEWQRGAGRIDVPIRWALPLTGAGIVAAGVTVSVLCDPIDVARGIGVAGIALTACAGLLGVLHLAVRYIGNHTLPILGIRIPVLSLVLVCTCLALWNGPLTFHQARVVEATAQPSGSLRVAVKDWLDRELAVARTGGTEPSFLPLLLVGASGGGSKAAYWTDLVLDCAVGGAPPPDERSERSECGSDSQARRRARGVFLTSSVSGGSVGIAHYVQQLASVQNGEPWVDDSAGQDELSPTVAWGLFHDFPLMLASPVLSLLHIGVPDPRACHGGAWECRYNLDRAAVQENGIAGRRWDAPASADEALTKLWMEAIDEKSKTPTPATVFNTALAGSRGRVLVSPFDLAPKSIVDERCLPTELNPSEVVRDAIDARDMLATDRGRRFDFDVTTAALLSGRFPVVEPPARIGTAKTVKPNPGADDPCIPRGATRLPAVFVRDGGYVENSGLLTIVQLLPEIRRGVQEWQAQHPSPPVLVWAVSIDDDPTDLIAAARAESHRPRPTSIAAQAGADTLTALARETLLLHESPVECYLRISPDPRIGAHAATGWELSKTARAHDLIASVRADSQNEDAITVLRDFLAGFSRACERPSRVDAS